MNGKEKLFFDEDSIQVYMGSNDRRQHVMHVAETSLMHSLSDLVTSNGGHILELGFGMGICSNRIQQNPNVTSHTIIEVHPEVYQRALDWAKDKANVKVLLGDWIEVIPTIKDVKFHGVLHDTFSDPNIEKLIELVKPICEKGCVIAFFLNHQNKDLKVLKHTFNEDEIRSLPYRLAIDKGTREYDLKYTIVD